MSDVIAFKNGPFSAIAMGLPGDHAGKSAVRIFLVEGADKTALIDSGIHVGYDQLKQAFAELGKQVSDLDYLLLTHEHMDHVGNNAALKRDSDCTIFAHPARADRIADNMLNAKTIVHAFPEGEHFDLAEEYLDWMGPDAVPVERFFTEGDTVDLGGVTLEVIEFMGHSMGEVGFYDPASKTLIIADPLLPAFNPVLYLYEDANVMRATFQKIIDFIRDRGVETVMFAHEDPCGPDEAIAKAEDCRSRVDAIEASLLRRIKASPGSVFAALRDQICDEFEKVREWRALVSINASLKDFENRGLIRRHGDGWADAG
jgi:glyoxylase-like metal-dependent hydrolase (beta-lactamase superfamily II)